MTWSLKDGVPGRRIGPTMLSLFSFLRAFLGLRTTEKGKLDEVDKLDRSVEDCIQWPDSWNVEIQHVFPPHHTEASTFIFPVSNKRAFSHIFTFRAHIAFVVLRRMHVVPQLWFCYELSELPRMPENCVLFKILWFFFIFIFVCI